MAKLYYNTFGIMFAITVVLVIRYFLPQLFLWSTIIAGSMVLMMLSFNFFAWFVSNVWEFAGLFQDGDYLSYFIVDDGETDEPDDPTTEEEMFEVGEKVFVRYIDNASKVVRYTTPLEIKEVSQESYGYAYKVEMEDGEVIKVDSSHCSKILMTKEMKEIFFG